MDRRRIWRSARWTAARWRPSNEKGAVTGRHRSVRSRAANHGRARSRWAVKFVAHAAYSSRYSHIAARDVRATRRASPPDLTGGSCLRGACRVHPPRCPGEVRRTRPDRHLYVRHTLDIGSNPARPSRRSLPFECVVHNAARSRSRSLVRATALNGSRPTEVRRGASHAHLAGIV
jgi:hypothetical protein